MCFDSCVAQEKKRLAKPKFVEFSKYPQKLNR